MSGSSLVGTNTHDGSTANTVSPSDDSCSYPVDHNSGVAMRHDDASLEEGREISLLTSKVHGSLLKRRVKPSAVQSTAVDSTMITSRLFASRASSSSMEQLSQAVSVHVNNTSPSPSSSSIKEATLTISTAGDAESVS